MNKLNGWFKVLAVIIAIVVQAMVLGNNTGRQDEAIANLKTGQKDIKETLNKIDNRIINHIGQHK